MKEKVETTPKEVSPKNQNLYLEYKVGKDSREEENYKLETLVPRNIDLLSIQEELNAQLKEVEEDLLFDSENEYFEDIDIIERKNISQLLEKILDPIIFKGKKKGRKKNR
jgi:hypothetical protein